VAVGGTLSAGHIPMRARSPERIASGNGYAQCQRPAGHTGACHAAGKSWYQVGDLGKRLRFGTPNLADCPPMPKAPQRPGRASLERPRPGTTRRNNRR
jgi:hypothetical protein